MTEPVARAEARGPCCRSPTGPTMIDYIDRGLRRSRRGSLPIAGDARSDDAGRFARFSLRVDGGVITEVAFETSFCVTLIAYCEVLAERVTGLTIRAAAGRIRPLELTSALPLVPAEKRNLALLGSQALMAAVLQAAKEESV
jgi:NifU-like protein involved in Fe-S cluster formation